MYTCIQILHVHKNANMQICKHASIQVFRCANTRVCIWYIQTSMQIWIYYLMCKYWSIKICNCKNANAYIYRFMQICYAYMHVSRFDEASRSNRKLSCVGEKLCSESLACFVDVVWQHPWICDFVKILHSGFTEIINIKFMVHAASTCAANKHDLPCACQCMFLMSWLWVAKYVHYLICVACWLLCFQLKYITGLVHVNKVDQFWVCG